jgi:AraC-like DNA-binding protein
VKFHARGRLRGLDPRPSGAGTNPNRVNVLVDPSPERRIIDLRKLGFRDVLVLGRYHYNEVHRPLKPHAHGNVIEICLLVRGCQTYVVEGQIYVLKGGDVLFTRPHEVHGTGGNPEDRGTLYWMLIRVPGSRERFLSLAGNKQRQLFRELFGLPSRSFSSQGRLKPQMDQIMSAYEDGRNPLRFQKLTSLLLRFLLDFIELGRQSRPGEVSGPIGRAQAYVEANLEEHLSVARLAAVARLSPSRFRARFRDETGLPPADYVARQKIEEAKKRLAHAEHTITRVAVDLGFCTSQYFATVFRKHAGVSPSVFRQRAGHGISPLSHV